HSAVRATAAAAAAVAGPPPAPEPAVTDADRALADAIAAAGGVVVPFAFVFDAPEAAVTSPSPAIEAAAFRVVYAGPGVSALPLPHPAGIVAPPEPLLAAGFPAHMTVFVEPDGSLRHAHPALPFGEAWYPSLPLEAARLFLGLERTA